MARAVLMTVLEAISDDFRLNAAFQNSTCLLLSGYVGHLMSSIVKFDQHVEILPRQAQRSDRLRSDPVSNPVYQKNFQCQDQRRKMEIIGVELNLAE